MANAAVQPALTAEMHTEPAAARASAARRATADGHRHGCALTGAHRRDVDGRTACAHGPALGSAAAPTAMPGGA